MSPSEVLKSKFGYDNFRAGQQEIIESISSGENVLSIMPTGGGKSLCFQIPALLGQNCSIVVSPLISLMQDQVEALKQKGIGADYINSSLSFGEQAEVFRRIRSGQTKLLYVSPEKLSKENFVQEIRSLLIDYLFVDEAHCISEWGHNFRPSYLKIKEFIDSAGITKISAFTATATPEVRTDIIKNLEIPDAESFVFGFERKNIEINVYKKSKKNRTFELLKNLDGSAIIYASSRKSAEDISKFLMTKGISNAFYHAGLTSEVRKRIQDDFISDKFNIICATNAFGMGIDKPDIRLVIHFNMPGSIENYYQEIGRAGRDGKPSSAVLLFDENDIRIHEFFIEKSFPGESELIRIYNSVYDFGGVPLGGGSGLKLQLDEKFKLLLKKNNISLTDFEKALPIFEAAGILKSSAKSRNETNFKVLLSPAELKKYIRRIARNDIRDLLITIIRRHGASLFQDYVRADMQQLSKLSEMPVKQIKQLLSLLSNSGIILTAGENAGINIQIQKDRVKPSALDIDWSALDHKKEHAKKKLEEMIDFVLSKHCRFGHILKYFGDEKEDYRCGKCDNCRTSGVENFDEFVCENISAALEDSHSGLERKSLLKILSGKTEIHELKSNGAFESCANYSKQNIDENISYLLLRKEIFLNDGLISLHAPTTGTKQNDTDEEMDYQAKLEAFNRLREIRKSASKKFSQPANMICPDEVLNRIAESIPVTVGELLRIEGFNDRMMTKLGDEILEYTNSVKKKRNLQIKIAERELPSHLITIAEFIDKGLTLELIAEQMRLPTALVSMQIESLLEIEPQTSIEKLLPEKILKSIRNEIKGGTVELKSLRKKLPSPIGYPEIRVVLAKWKLNSRN